MKRRMGSQSAETASVSGHSKGKLSRQRAILQAARDIIINLGETGLTMRDLAVKAGVSPTTPYNLFGSKQAVLQAIYEEDRVGFLAIFEASASAEPLARLFDLIDLTIQRWATAPEFYRPLLSILHRNSESEVGAGAWSPRLASTRLLVKDAVDAGALSPETPIDLVTATLLRTFKAVGQEWVEHTLTIDQAGRQLGAGFSLVLASLITPKSAPELARIRQRYYPVS